MFTHLLIISHNSSHIVMFIFFVSSLFIYPFVTASFPSTTVVASSSFHFSASPPSTFRNFAATSFPLRLYVYFFVFFLLPLVSSFSSSSHSISFSFVGLQHFVVRERVNKKTNLNIVQRFLWFLYKNSFSMLESSATSLLKDLQKTRSWAQDPCSRFSTKDALI